MGRPSSKYTKTSREIARKISANKKTVTTKPKRLENVRHGKKIMVASQDIGRTDKTHRKKK